ncbi:MULTISPECIES: hypothetical protein [unclassified Streptomyces]|uniref:hypothetical protein n=1 Tax=unclassified Streptomyces TaxID=2593676 RepID=UPI002DD98DA3|nr:hypothetical protein [Streptomyces sp. NBC_00243]WRZ22675.1 hypothetical protein OHT59_31430 [Streptomyces sp. NBC_00243]
MNDPLTLINGTEANTTEQGTKWRFSVIPPKDVRTEVYRKLKAVRRPSGTLALPAIAATGSLHFTHVLHDSDSLMALGLTALLVGYDAVIAVCRTWIKTSNSPVTHEASAHTQRAA